MADNQVVITVKGEDRTSAAFDSAKRSAEGLGSKMGTALKAGGLLAGAGIGVAAVAAFDFVKAAAAEQVGIERLKTAIGTLDAAHRGNAAAVENVVKAGEKLAFTDDEVRDSLSILIAQTGDYEQAVERQRIAMDIARGTGMDFATASRLIGKINEETTSTFARYGIVIKKGATEQEALATIQAKFAGQATTYAGTATAKWKIFQNQIQNIKESIGAALLPTVTTLGAKLGDFLTKHQPDIDRFSAALAEKIPKAIDAIGNAIEALRPTMAFLFENIKAGFETIKPALEWVISHKPAMVAALTAIGIAAILAFTPITVPVLAVIVALGALFVAIGLMRRHWDEIKAKTLEIWNSIPGPVQDAIKLIVEVVKTQFLIIKNAVETAFNVIRDVIRIATALWKGDWGEAWKGIKQLGLDIFEGFVTDITLKLSFLRTAFGFVFDGVSRIIAAAFDGMRRAGVNALNDLIEKLNAVIGVLNKAIDAFNKLPGGDIGNIPLVPTLGAGAPLGAATGSSAQRPGRLTEFATGTPFVPHDMLAFLHRGEAVVPAGQNRGDEISININVTAQHDVRSIVEMVARRLEQELIVSGFRGSRGATGPYQPVGG